MTTNPTLRKHRSPRPRRTALAAVLGLIVGTFAAIPAVSAAEPVTRTVCATATDGCELVGVAAAQSAMNAAAAGDIFNFAAGEYSGTLSINTSVVVNGAMAGTKATDPGRQAGSSAETVFQGTSIAGIPGIKINAPNVVLDGFSITHVASTSLSTVFAVQVTNISSGAIIRNNFVYGVSSFPSSGGATANGIYISDNNAAAPSNLQVLDNYIFDMDGKNSVKPMWVGPTGSALASRDFLIQGNMVRDIKSTLKGAYGFLLNRSGQTTNLQIWGNTFTDLAGAWTHAVGIEGPESPVPLTGAVNVSIKNNAFSSLAQNSAATRTDLVAVGVYPSESVATYVVHHNDFSLVSRGVANGNPYVTLNADHNYWGSEGPGAAATYGLVYSAPWITGFEPDAAHSVGFWPTDIVLSEAPAVVTLPPPAAGQTSQEVALQASEVPTVVTAPTAGNPSLTLPASDEPVTVTFAVLAPAALPDVDVAPFVLTDAVLVDISVEDLQGSPVNGSFTVCINGTSPQRLWHYETNAWIDVTKPAPEGYIDGKVCGSVTSFSPFALADAMSVTSIIYAGDTFVTTNSVSLKAVLSGCAEGSTVVFKQAGFGSDSYSVVGSGTTNAAGEATFAWTGVTAGVYEILAIFEETAECFGSSVSAAVVVASGGEASTGGGFYTTSGGMGKINFGYTAQVRKADKRNPVDTVTGQLLWNTKEFRVKGLVTGYTTVPCTGIKIDASTEATGTCAVLTGRASVYEWDESLNDGLGGWGPAIATGVSFTTTVVDGVSVSTKKGGSKVAPDYFRMYLPDFPALNIAFVSLVKGNLVVK